jgi:hypothetical protein
MAGINRDAEPPKSGNRAGGSVTGRALHTTSQFHAWRFRVVQGTVPGTPLDQAALGKAPRKLASSLTTGVALWPYRRSALLDGFSGASGSISVRLLVRPGVWGELAATFRSWGSDQSRREGTCGSQCDTRDSIPGNWRQETVWLDIMSGQSPQCG